MRAEDLLVFRQQAKGQALRQCGVVPYVLLLACALRGGGGPLPLAPRGGANASPSAHVLAVHVIASAGRTPIRSIGRLFGSVCVGVCVCVAIAIWLQALCYGYRALIVAFAHAMASSVVLRSTDSKIWAHSAAQVSEAVNALRGGDAHLPTRALHMFASTLVDKLASQGRSFRSLQEVSKFLRDNRSRSLANRLSKVDVTCSVMRHLTEAAIAQLEAVITSVVLYGGAEVADQSPRPMGGGGRGCAASTGPLSGPAADSTTALAWRTNGVMLAGPRRCVHAGHR